MNKRILANRPKNARILKDSKILALSFATVRCTIIPMEESITFGEEQGSYVENFIIAAIVIIALIFIGYVLSIAQKKSAVAEQQLELRILTDAVTMYEIHYDEFPINQANFNRWCVVGQEYKYGICLGELTNSNYLRDIPEKNSRKVYYYQIRDNVAYIATPLDTTLFDIPLEELCYGNMGEAMLCYQTS